MAGQPGWHIIHIFWGNRNPIGYNEDAKGMTGFDGGGWSRIASREVPTS